MERTFSSNFKKLFLLTFTRELIKQSEKREIVKLQNIIKSEEYKIKRPIIREKQFFKPEIRRVIKKTPVMKPVRKLLTKQIQITKPSLVIPESKLPEHLQYLKPVPAREVEIDLGKLNPLIKDRAVKIIEVNPDEKVIVTGNMGTKPTNIVLNKDEINSIIKKFSEISKIPTEEGVYRVVIGNLSLSAIISEVIGSKFVIRKVTAPPQVNRPQNTQVSRTIPNSLRK